MSTRTRWLVVVGVLAVAGGVALWPRADDRPPAGPTRPAKDLAALRGQAALRPCPPAVRGGQSGGLRVTCLGDGAAGDLALKGPLLLNFWATWCGPCKDELPVLDAYSQRPGAVPVLAVLVESKEGDGLELLARLGAHLPSVFDESDAVRTEVRAPRTLPASYLVGADGSVRQVTDPLVFTSPDQVREAVG